MNIANITKRFALYSGIDGAEAYKWKSIIDDAVVYVNSIVTKGNLSEDDELRLENLCAVYAFKLYSLCNDDSISSFSAGDLKISSSADRRKPCRKAVEGICRQVAGPYRQRKIFAWGDMMNISPSIGKILNRYGCDVTVKNGGKSVRTKAFISPLRYNSNQNYDSIRHKLGMRKTKLFLFIAPPDVLLDSEKSVIESENGKYTVKRCEKYYVKDNPIYVRAVLCAYREETRDDFESN